MMKLHTRILIVIAFAATMARGDGRYVVVLKPGAAKSPDVAAIGGTILYSQFDRIVAMLPDDAVDALRKSPAVRYVQRSAMPGERPAVSSASAGFHAASNGTESTTFGPFVYDAAGSITTIGSESYTYDLVGRLK